jgi:hypothetical protein
MKRNKNSNFKLKSGGSILDQSTFIDVHDSDSLSKEFKSMVLKKHVLD